MHDVGLVEEVVLGNDDAYPGMVFEKNGEFHPCDIAVGESAQLCVHLDVHSQLAISS